MVAQQHGRDLTVCRIAKQIIVNLGDEQLGMQLRYAIDLQGDDICL